jgi:hypothetical protein
VPCRSTASADAQALPTPAPRPRQDVIHNAESLESMAREQDAKQNTKSKKKEENQFIEPLLNKLQARLP